VADAKDLIRQFGKAGIGNTTVQNAIHLLARERQRVRDWQANPPANVSAGSDFGVRAVEIAPGVIGTYGEMNTLADYFGSLKDLKAVRPATVTKVLQTEREDFYGWLGQQLTELTKADYVERNETMVVGSGMTAQAVTVKVRYFKNERAYLQDDGGASAPYNIKGSPGLVDQAFAGTQSGLTTNLSQPLEKVVSGVSGQHGADLPVRTDPGTVARGTGGAWGAIARNACHFAPESWYAWKKYHLEARQHARNAHQLGLQGNTAAADKAANEAWLANGFGDHYLQDSFASGHLINKTLIMQWFLEWAKTWKVIGPSSGTLDTMSLMSEAQQPGLASTQLYSKDSGLQAKGPQASSERATAAGAFTAAGLQRPGLLGGATALLRWWRTEIARGIDENDRESARTLTVRDFKRIKPDVPEIVSQEHLGSVLEQLRGQGFVKKKVGFGILDPDYVLIEQPEFLRETEAASGSKAYDPATTMTMAAYLEFMNSAFLQSGAGALHDYFCKQGLTVSDDAGNNQFKVYGDNALLDQGAGAGVRMAGTAGRMSRAAIDDVLAGGPGAPTVDEIFARFPSKAVLPPTFGDQPVPNAGTELPLEQFLRRLKPQMNPVWNKWGHWFAARIPSPHARGGLVEPSQLNRHSGEEF
jgi:hypothetical protein